MRDISVNHSSKVKILGFLVMHILLSFLQNVQIIRTILNRQFKIIFLKTTTKRSGKKIFSHIHRSQKEKRAARITLTIIRT